MIKISENLFKWLENEWKISNHTKYQKYFNEWINNLTETQIQGFDKMRKADYITNNN